jgi:branched-chain amino acid transport system ATP-binding protein
MLQVESVTKRFGGLLAVDQVSVEAQHGRITGLIGPNGAGKTTLFAVIAGFEAPSAGRVLLDGVDVTDETAHRRAARGIARTFQVVQPFAGLTVRENIAVGAHLRLASRKEALACADAVADRVGLARDRDKSAASLTAAGLKRLELGRALATDPKLLLLDEVLAGLNPSEIRDMLPVVRAICESGVAILMVEHVMQAVMSLCEHIYVLAEGRVIAAGSPEAVSSDPRVIEAYLGHGAAARTRKTEPDRA